MRHKRHALPKTRVDILNGDGLPLKPISGAMRPARPPCDTRWLAAFKATVHGASIPAWTMLKAVKGEAQILGHFRRAIDIAIGQSIIALVTPQVGHGPFNLVVDALPIRSPRQTIKVWWTSHSLHIGNWQFYIAQDLYLWDPSPSWHTLCLDPHRLHQLRMLAKRAAQDKVSHSPFARLLLGKTLPAVTTMGNALRAGDKAAIARSTAAIAGMGPGLTPAGDDFLMGMMLGIHAYATQHARDAVTPLTDCIYKAAASRTTRLSRAFLRAAAQGYADARWHRLLAALGKRNPPQLEPSAEAVLKFGASSGVDTMAGFLWYRDLFS